MDTIYKNLAGKKASIEIHGMIINLLTLGVRRNNDIIEVEITPLDGYRTTWIDNRLIKIYDNDFCRINKELLK